MKSNLELIKPDESDEKGCGKPSPDDRVIHLLPAAALDNEPDGDVIAGYRFIANGPNGMRMALEMTQLRRREIDESAINAGQRAYGAVTPHVLTCEEGLSNFNRAGERAKRASALARVEPALGWVTHVDITNEKPNSVGVCRPQCCHSTKSPLKLGAFRLVMQVDDCATVVEVPSSHEVVSPRKIFFVLNQSTLSEDVKPSQDNRTTRIHVPRCEGTKFHPNSLAQDSVNMSKVLNPAMGVLKAKDTRRSPFAGKVTARERGSLLRRERGRPQNVSFPSSGTPQDIWRIENIVTTATMVLTKQPVRPGGRFGP